MKACPLALLIAALTLLQGCETRVVEVAKPYEVPVPYPVEKRAPDDLVRAYIPTDYPEFVNPGEPNVVYGLTQEGWQRLQVILRTMQTRDQAWRSWATGHGEPND